MGTKNNPSPFDGYAKALPDEPYFVLLGRDPQAADLIRLWAIGRDFMIGEDAKVSEARKCADEMAKWCVEQAGGQPLSALTLLPFQSLASELRNRSATVMPAGAGLDLGDADD